MRTDTEHTDTAIDEYLWPLTGDLTAVNWEALAEEMQLRERLAEITAHVRELHVQPRLRRLGTQPSPTLVRAMTEGVITGPEGGPPWLQTLREPVPRALRDEWATLTERLRAIDERRRRAPTSGR